MVTGPGPSSSESASSETIRRLIIVIERPAYDVVTRPDDGPGWLSRHQPARAPGAARPRSGTPDAGPRAAHDQGRAPGVARGGAQVLEVRLEVRKVPVVHGQDSALST